MKSSTHGLLEYQTESEISIGDVLIMRKDVESPHAGFSTEIVYSMDEDLVFLARPHLRAHQVGSLSGDFSIQVERHQVYKKAILHYYLVFTNGGDKKDNRRDN